MFRPSTRTKLIPTCRAGVIRHLRTAPVDFTQVLLSQLSARHAGRLISDRGTYVRGLQGIDEEATRGLRPSLARDPTVDSKKPYLYSATRCGVPHTRTDTLPGARCLLNMTQMSSSSTTSRVAIQARLGHPTPGRQGQLAEFVAATLVL